MSTGKKVIWKETYRARIKGPLVENDIPINSVNFFVLLASDVQKSLFAYPSAYEVTKDRLQRKIWGLNKNTKNRRKISVGDNLLFYTSGTRENCRAFIASARVAAKIDHPSLEEHHSVDPLYHKYVGVPDVIIKLDNVIYLNRSVPINEIKARLSFIKAPESPKWGAFLQGGCITITYADFEEVKAAAKNHFHK